MHTAILSCSICGTRLAGAQSRTCDNSRCKNAFQVSLGSQIPHCLVCAKPLLDPIGPGEPPVCEHPHCQSEHSRKVDVGTDLARCKVCNVPLPDNRDSFDLCGDQNCAVVNANWLVQEREAKRQRTRDKMERAAIRLRDKRAKNENIDDPNRFKIALVPSARAELTVSDSQRVNAFRDTIEGLVTTAFDQEHAPICSSQVSSVDEKPSSATETKLFQTSCRLCQGKCCRAGNTHAFLDVVTIDRVRTQKPDLTREEIVNEYTSRVPSHSVVDSCVFHSEQGCSLPRGMRADVCNRSLCGDLFEIRRSLSESENDDRFIASIDESEIVATEFVEPP